jgi:hypothetical protein
MTVGTPCSSSAMKRSLLPSLGRLKFHPMSWKEGGVSFQKWWAWPHSLVMHEATRGNTNEAER